MVAIVLVNELANGGFGEVYVAENLTLHNNESRSALYSSFDAMDLEQFCKKQRYHHLFIIRMLYM